MRIEHLNAHIVNLTMYVPLGDSMHPSRRKKYTAMTLPHLRKLREKLMDDLDAVIKEIEAGPRREIDIGAEHSGDPELVHEILETMGDKQSGKWKQLEKIYCCRERCPRCPHGPFWYKFRVIKRQKRTAMDYLGMLVFDYDALKRMEKRIKRSI